MLFFSAHVEGFMNWCWLFNSRENFWLVYSRFGSSLHIGSIGGSIGTSVGWSFGKELLGLIVNGSGSVLPGQGCIGELFVVEGIVGMWACGSEKVRKLEVGRVVQVDCLANGNELSLKITFLEIYDLFIRSKTFISSMIRAITNEGAFNWIEFVVIKVLSIWEAGSAKTRRVSY